MVLRLLFFTLPIAFVFLPRILNLDPETDLVVLRWAVGSLLLIVGWQALSLRSVHRDLRRMEELLVDVRFGTGVRRDRDAVDILVKALRTPDERARETALRTLRKISGVDLGAEPEPWEAWWRAARATFVRPGNQPLPAPGPRPGKK